MASAPEDQQVAQCVAAMRELFGTVHSEEEIVSAAIAHNGVLDSAIDELQKPTRSDPQPNAVAAVAAASHSAKRSKEPRRWAEDGGAYTLREFIEYYGGSVAEPPWQWDEAEPEHPPAPAKPAAAPPPPRARAAAAASGSKPKSAAAAASPAPPAAASGGKPKSAAAAAAAPPAAAAGGEEAAAAWPSRQLNLCVIGHVDAGKSSLMGQLLLLRGEVDGRTMHRYERESRECGKASFKFAWVLDQAEEERARGVTIQVGSAFLRSERWEVNVLDAPGHRDFVPNMIGGVAQADAALLVVNAARGEFEAGLSGQTQEHLVVARSLGVAQLLVAVNQMDLAAWARERFAEVKQRLAPVLQQSGYAPAETRFVPLSALAGVNLVAKAALPAEMSWWAAEADGGGSLLEEIDRLHPAARTSAVGCRVVVNDVSSSAGGLVVVGTLQSGTLRQGQKMLLPGHEVVTLKTLHSRNQPALQATAGDHVELGLHGVPDAHAIDVGSVLSAPNSPARLVRCIEVTLRTFQPPAPLTKGQPFEMYCHTSAVCATLRKIVCSVDKFGQRTESRPRSLLGGTAAVVQLDLERSICVELHNDCRQLGRLVLREAGRTLAAGVVTAIIR
ncbi:hypothetical protein AB1Y20_013832 [Prymnesium parvum]|uniref:Tr-type G domain-containing protein n=1 Tax=Prymnesium parvum TaxID=97485 RepID=A0AB34IGM1_PRYPA